MLRRAFAKRENPAVPDGGEQPRGKPVAGLLRGFKDLLPKDGALWEWVVRRAEDMSHAYGFDRIEVPHLEEMRLFVRAVGKETDIVEKELFSFPDRDNTMVALRPEFTASIARAYIEHGLLNLPQPVRVFTIGSLIRYERTQAGRFREHHQWDVEVLGDAHPVLDAEVILLAVRFYQSLGLPVSVSINSIGCATCRPAYREALVAYARTRRKQLCEHCQRRLTRNPLRILDCKEETCRPVREGAPHIVDALCEGCKNHFVKVLEYCDALSVPYELSPHLVRGLDYYTKTVFECTTTRSLETGETRIALGGGGRYDDLVELLGGRPTPAVGFGVGLERVVSELRHRNALPAIPTAPMVFVAQLGSAARERALQLAERLRNDGIGVRSSFSKDGLKSQLELANKHGALLTLIVGQKEVLDETVIVREMDGGIQEIVPYDKIVADIRRKLARVSVPMVMTGTPTAPHTTEEEQKMRAREHKRLRGQDEITEEEGEEEREAPDPTASSEPL